MNKFYNYQNQHIEKCHCLRILLLQKSIFLLLLGFLFVNGNLYAGTTNTPTCIDKREDITFGADTAWGDLLYNNNLNLAVAPDGCCFVSDFHQHQILKFSGAGKLVHTFGRKGEGPGDLYHPSYISVLDGKYLVVSQYALTKKISIFDLSCTFIKSIKTMHNDFGSTALKNNRIAYMSVSSKKSGIKKVSLFIKNITSQKEIAVTSFTFPDRSKIMTEQGVMITLENQVGDVSVASSPEGNLIVGCSNTNEIHIFSKEGKKIKSFVLKMKSIPVSIQYMNNFKKDVIDSFKGRRAPDYLKKALVKADYKRFFLEDLPFYRDFLVDSDGNILVFRWLDCASQCSKRFQVYSPEGDFLFESQLQSDKYRFEIKSYINNIVFHKGFIYGLFKRNGCDDESLRIVKIKTL